MAWIDLSGKRGNAMLILKTTLCLTVAAALVNFWLGMRCGQIRTAEKISVGDGGNELLMRRMRAQANFVEQAPITLLLFALVELAGRGSWWIAPLGAAFIIGRICHGFGMDGNFKAGRPIGMITGILAQAVLAVVAILAASGM